MTQNSQSALIRFHAVATHKPMGGESELLTFSVGAGERMAVIGPRGSGVENVLALATGEMAPHAGQIEVTGPQRPGVVFAEPSLDEDLKLQSNLTFFGGLFGLFGRDLRRRISELSELLGIGHLLAVRADALHPLEARLADVARALIHRPRLLLINDPTMPLDDDARTIWRARVDTAVDREGTAVLFTGHAHSCPISGCRILYLGPRDVPARPETDHAITEAVAARAAASTGQSRHPTSQPAGE